MIMDGGPSLTKKKIVVDKKGRKTRKVGPAIERAAGTYKQIICLRNDVGMGGAKMVAAACDGTLGAFKTLWKARDGALILWEKAGNTKDLVYVQGEETFDKIVARAKSLGICAYVVTSGEERTKVCLALGPALVEDLNRLIPSSAPG